MSGKNSHFAAGSSPVMPLEMAQRSETVELVSVRGGMGLQRRLAEMGVGPGSRFVVETCRRPGPVVIRVLGSRLVLGHGMASRVFVRPIKQ